MGAMENAIHSTWKSEMQLSHVLQTAFPTAPKKAASYPHSHTAD